ncbi:hypothetical protein [Pseudoalteromonas luteoviolacea]|uniref:hypothetical protein n=1 Tax=Pseudoalteromonas luteoviolacea TaxID=43657 RepID=UPI001153E030|nr:hypothetical protein [Pseudoalteromonas luteoviolacea]TQF71065.1 hypothetical protein FLM44_08245 [Pseudoalteromonas luteoviolacea]
MESKIVDQLRGCIHFSKNLNYKPTVFIVANIVGCFDWVYDYDKYPSDAQGYTELEIELFSESIRSMGFPVEVFTSEKAFFQYVSSHLEPAKLVDSILYNMAEGGKGPGQKALMPAFAKFYGIKVCNSSPHANSICHHKYHVNQLLISNHLPTPKSWLYDGTQFLNGKPKGGEKVIAKPIYESMCLGVDATSCFIWDDSKADYLSNKCRELNQPFLIQTYISGYEICCPIIKLEEVSSLGVIGFGIDGNEYLKDEYKVYEGHKQHEYFSYIPEISPQLKRDIMLTAEKTFLLLGMSGVGRIDFRVTASGDFFIFDTNESPPPKKGTALYNTLLNLGLEEKEALQAFFCVGAAKIL